jgi:AraC-like DNA-binding protein
MVNRKRMKVAYDKICSDNKKVSNVYLEVGFKNLSHFSTAFKKQYGYCKWNNFIPNIGRGNSA